MKPHSTFPRKRPEAGVALLIAIFILLLVSGIALALVANSGTESSLAGNYRSSTSVNDAGFAGLEEARGRLLPRSPGDLNVIPGFMPTPLLVNQVRYILNPVNPADVVAPTTAGSAYADTEYGQEFPLGLAGATVQTTNSVWANSAVAGMPSPMYKWVRITPATEQSLNIDVNADGFKDPVTPLYYDAAPASGAKPSLIVVPTAPVGVPSTASQVFEVTALAVLPNGSRKIEQYVVSPVTYNLTFPSALSLPGANAAFAGASSSQWLANGQDGSGAGNNSSYAPVTGCAPNLNTSLPAVGVTDPSGGTANVQAVNSGIPSNRTGNYTGAGLATPSVANITLNSALQSPASLNQLVQTITQNADLVYNGNTIWNSYTPPGMSQMNPMTVVVNGDFQMKGTLTGYGLLVVTGNFAYSGTTGWDGIILVIGSGTTTFLGNGGGNAGFNGALFVATTTDALGNTLPALGNVSFSINGGGGNGIYYDSCWIKNSQKPITYQVLSYREISQ